MPCHLKTQHLVKNINPPFFFLKKMGFFVLQVCNRDGNVAMIEIKNNSFIQIKKFIIQNGV